MASANPLHTTDTTTVKGTESTSSTSKASKNLFNAVYGSMKTSAKAETPLPPTTSSDSPTNTTAAPTDSSIGQVGLAANNATLAGQEAQIQAAEANPLAAIGKSTSPGLDIAGNSTLNQPVSNGSEIQTTPVIAAAANGIMETPNQIGQVGLAANNATLAGQEAQIQAKSAVPVEITSTTAKPEVANIVPLATVTDTTIPVTKPEIASQTPATKEVSLGNGVIASVHNGVTQVTAPDGNPLTISNGEVKAAKGPILTSATTKVGTRSTVNTLHGIATDTTYKEFKTFKETLNGDTLYGTNLTPEQFSAQFKQLSANTLVKFGNGDTLYVDAQGVQHFYTPQDTSPHNTPVPTELTNLGNQMHVGHTNISITNSTGATVLTYDTITGSIGNSDFTLSASGNVTLWNGETILANGSIQDSYGNTIYDNNNDTTDSSSFNNNPNFNNTATLNDSVDGIVNNIDGKVSSGDISLSDIGHLELCLGALDNAMARAQAMGNVALISDLSGCQATIGNILGQAQAALKTDSNTHPTANTNITKPKNDFNHYDIMNQHSNYNFSSTAKLLYA